MTAVPKPLKFLRPHYESLEKTYESWPEGENKVRSRPAAFEDRILTVVAAIISRHAFSAWHDLLGREPT